MHDGFLKDAIKELIRDNSSTLLKELMAQGEARQLGHLTTSILTPARSYYFVAIHCEESAEYSATSRSNQTQRPPRNVRYDVLIHIEEYAIPDDADEELYETAHRNFDKFVNRIASLIEQQNWIGSGPKFRLERGENDRAIRRSNIPQMWYDEAEAYHAMLTSQLRFVLVQECVDNSVLYP